MKKRLVTYKQAENLAVLDFNEPCVAFVDNKGYLEYSDPKKPLSNSDHERNQESAFTYALENDGTLDQLCDATVQCLAMPTFSQAFAWFRDKYSFYHNILPISPKYMPGLVEFHCHVYRGYPAKLKVLKSFNTYEKAESHCLNYMIRIANLKSKPTTL